MIYQKIYELDNLQAAWQRVRLNRPGPGIDRVRWEDFEAHLAYNLAILQKQLQDESYNPLPVAVFTDRKGKSQGRTIGISTIRDRVVQQAVLRTITPYFEPHFLPCNYAYRPGKSAIMAVRQASQLIAQGKLWVLQMDVAAFFDTLDHHLLLGLIGKAVTEKPLLRLISRLLKAKIFREMELVDNTLGSQQGSGLSPLLSNIYLHPMDVTLWNRYHDSYLRYSDDLTLFAEERDTLEEAQHFITQCLGEIKLSPNQQKSSISHVSAGFVLLGFYMDVKGKGPAQKAVEKFQERLRAYEKVRRTDDLEAILDEIKSSVRGWYNYYQTLQPLNPENILSLLVLVELSMELGETNLAKQWLKESEKFPHRHPLIAFRLGEFFSNLGMKNQALREYALALDLDPHLEVAKEKIRALQEDEAQVHGAIEKIQLVLHQNPHYREGYEKLAHYYSELGLYGFAEKAHQKALELDDDLTPLPQEISSLPDEDSSSLPDFDYQNIDLQLFLSIFSGRLEAHAKQWADERGRWGFVRVDRPLKTKDIYKHLAGESTLGVYPVTARDTVRFIVFDVDNAKRTILEAAPQTLPELRLNAHQDIVRLKHVCEGLGLTMYLEDSGYKGRHGWLFFSEEAPATLALQLGKDLMKMAGGPTEGIIWELFPMGKTHRHQSIIKLPMGINRKSNRRGLFLTEDNHAIADQGLFLKTIKANPLELIKKLVHQDRDPMADQEAAADWQKKAPGLFKMVNECLILKHLIAKARDTNYLNHYERLCLLYTLSFAGDEGCRLLHQTIAYCLNYDYQFTQQQIERRKTSPISCAKIMEYFPELAETLPCKCTFRLPPRSYPSPVLYLLEAELTGAASPAAAATPPEREETPDTHRQEILGGEQDVVETQPDREEAPATPGEDTPPAGPHLLNFEEIFASEIAQEETPEESEVQAAPSSSGVEFINVQSAQENISANPSDPVKTEDIMEETSPEIGVGQGSDQCNAPESLMSSENSNDWEAYQLTLELLSLHLKQATNARRLQEVSDRLTTIFKNQQSDSIRTEIGAVRRMCRDDGTIEWIVTTIS